MLSDEQDATELANNVIALAASILPMVEQLSAYAYEDDEDHRRMLMGYMGVLLLKHNMDEVIDNNFQEPLEFRMGCLESVQHIFNQMKE